MAGSKIAFEGDPTAVTMALRQRGLLRPRAEWGYSNTIMSFEGIVTGVGRGMSFADLRKKRLGAAQDEVERILHI